MKKKLIFGLICLLVLVSIVFGFSKWRTEKHEKYGVVLKKPVAWTGEFVKGKIKKDHSDEKGINDITFEVVAGYNVNSENLCSIVVVDNENKNHLDELLNVFDNKIKLGERDTKQYYLFYKYPSEAYMEKNVIDKGLKQLEESFEFIDIKSLANTISKIDKIEFTTKDLDGNEVDSSIFKEYDITMINIWTTTCGPCKEEMPYLEEIYQEKKAGNINLIGIVKDAKDKSTIDLSKEIGEVKGTTYTTLYPNKEMEKLFLDDIRGLPRTIFVDSSGKIIGEPIAGAASKEKYEKEIEERLKIAKEGKKSDKED